MIADERAKALLRHAQYCGTPLDQFVLELTDSEGWEFLERQLALWEAHPNRHNCELLRMDIVAAKRANNPWPVLNNFTYRGLAICRRFGEVH